MNKRYAFAVILLISSFAHAESWGSYARKLCFWCASANSQKPVEVNESTDADASEEEPGEPGDHDVREDLEILQQAAVGNRK